MSHQDHQQDHQQDHHHPPGHQKQAHTHQDGLSELLDLDAEILAEPLRSVRADIASLMDSPVQRILDLGAGTGTGTFGLLEHFSHAHVVAVDGSADMLQLLRDRAAQLRLSERVSTVQADLDDGMPDLEGVDLGWASASLHHLADPDRTLGQLVAVIRPGGLLAVVELTGFPRFLADDSPGGAVEARAHALLSADRAADLPAMGSDWAHRLTTAGFVIEMSRVIDVDLVPPQAGLAGRYAFATLTRMRESVADRLGALDGDDLDRLLDGGSDDVRHRNDLRVTTQRQVLIGRRPAMP